MVLSTFGTGVLYLIHYYKVLNDNTMKWYGHIKRIDENRMMMSF